MNLHGGLVAEQQRGDPIVKSIVDKLYGGDAPTPLTSLEKRLESLLGALESLARQAELRQGPKDGWWAQELRLLVKETKEKA